MATINGVMTALMGLNVPGIDFDTVRLEMVPELNHTVKAAIRRESSSVLVYAKVAQFNGQAYAATDLDLKIKDQAGNPVRSATSNVLDIKTLGDGVSGELDFGVDQNDEFSAGDFCTLELISSNPGGNAHGPVLVHLLFKEEGP